jgi:D-alanyl-D-alanine dipeptidase
MSTSRQTRRHSSVRLAGALLWIGLPALGVTVAAPVGAQQAAPVEAGTFREPDLVELTALDATIRLDIRYATANNFTGRPVYKEARAFLQRPAAEALVRAHRKLKAHGYGALVFDGYRPWSVTRLFWDVTPPAQRNFVADPRKGSKHNRGCAVDLGLYALDTGAEVEMPSAYDDFTEKAHPTYRGGTEAQRRARDLLRSVMESEGFTVEPNEWWHFNHRDWRRYPILDIPFGALGRQAGGRSDTIELSIPAAR